MKYGIEFEFFVLDRDDNLIPAFEVTTNLDGNPVIGELRTVVHDSIATCVAELQSLIRKEEKALSKKGYHMSTLHTYKVSKEFLKELREKDGYASNICKSKLKELSIYANGKTGKVLPVDTYKVSLQINFSENATLDYFEESYSNTTKILFALLYKANHSNSGSRKEIKYSKLFDYPTIIGKLDKKFGAIIKSAKRIPGVYAIKSGQLGDRIEYRSLPATGIDLNELIKVLE